MKNLINITILTFALFIIVSCSVAKKHLTPETVMLDTIHAKISGQVLKLIINFERGDAHNHPTFVFWTEDMNENYLQTLFITKSFATGIFGYGPINDSLWGTEPGVAKRPAALPYWWHKCNPGSADVPSPEKPFLDAYTGATPEGSFILKTGTDINNKQKFRLLMEINQPWDWNNYWTTNKYPDDQAYKASSQPSVVYAVTVDPESGIKRFYLNPVGHGHYSGKNGKLYTDLSSVTSAKRIINNVCVEIHK